MKRLIVWLLLAVFAASSLAAPIVVNGPIVPAAAGGGGAVSVNALTTTGNCSGGDCQQAPGVSTLTLTGITVVAGSNRWLTVEVVWGGNGTTITGRSVTALVGAVPTAMTEEIFTSVAPSGGKAVAIYTIANPDTGAQSIVASWTGSIQDTYLSAKCFNNVSSVNAAHTQSGATNALTMTSGANDATVTAISTDNGDPTSSQTRSFAESPHAPGGAADYALGGSSNTHTYGNAGTVQAIVGIHLVN